MPLVAYNVNLGTDLDIADAIDRKVRHISGGLHYCKGIGIELKERGIVQVSMNLTDYILEQPFTARLNWSKSRRDGTA